MSETILFLSRPATEGLALIHLGTAPKKRVEPVWRLLLTAVFAAVAALACATVVIFGTPNADSAAKGDPVHMMITRPSH